MTAARDGRMRTQIISDSENGLVGYLKTELVRFERSLEVAEFVLQTGAAAVAVMPSVLRALARQIHELPLRRPDILPPAGVRFWLSPRDPACLALPEGWMGAVDPAYAWYVRVPDLPGLLRLLAPVLEQRLATSMWSNHSGELKIDFYRGGLRLVWENGRLQTVEPWTAPVLDRGNQAGYPPGVFLQQLFGYRSLPELAYAFPDVLAEAPWSNLLTTLFPQQPSWAVPLS
ncbi:MAG: hypothetical protein NVS4B8_08310 [Herpetosiphon sp.]